MGNEQLNPADILRMSFDGKTVQLDDHCAFVDALKKKSVVRRVTERQGPVRRGNSRPISLVYHSSAHI